MKAIILIGIQGSGKSTFYKKMFADTHVRINLDMLKNRSREHAFVQTCVLTKQPFVADNTNPTLDDRQRYIQTARLNQFKIAGYYFSSDLDSCLERNAKREGKKMIPKAGILSILRKLVVPSKDEGFDELYEVNIDPETNEFITRKTYPNDDAS